MKPISTKKAVPPMVYNPEELEEARLRYWQSAQELIESDYPAPGTFGRFMFDLKYQVGRLLGRW